MSDPKEVYALGWDVRGWKGREQATAVARLEPGDGEVEWLGVSSPFQFKSGTQSSLVDLLKPAIGNSHEEFVRNARRFVVAIDAPLGFPTELTKMLNHQGAVPVVPEREIDNPFAYRYCERWIAETFGRKPLSATFDKLGNNATLAMAVSLTLEKEGFTRIPQSGTNRSKSVIEVYPALVKDTGQGPQGAIPQIGRRLPPGLAIGSDPYDAAICAVLGLAFLGMHEELGLEPMIEPPADIDVHEGWIYTIPVS